MLMNEGGTASRRLKHRRDGKNKKKKRKRDREGEGEREESVAVCKTLLLPA